MICAYHRYTLEIWWSQPKVCSYPLHQLVGKGKKGSDTRAAPEETWNVICSQHPDLYFLFGSRLYYQHLKIHKTGSVSEEHVTTGVSVDDYEPKDMYIKHDKFESSKCVAENIAECHETSPILQLKRKTVGDVGESTKKYYRKNLEQ